MMSVTDILDQI